MKTKILLPATFLTCAIGLPLHSQPPQKADGWYYLTDYENQTVSAEPIVTVADFETLRIDSALDRNNLTNYYLTGKIKTDKAPAFAEATEKWTGKHIAFLYQGEILTAPRVNMRIDGGNFMITSPQWRQDKVKILDIFRQLENQMK